MSTTTKIDTGGSIYPLPDGHMPRSTWHAGYGEFESREAVCTDGMTLLDHFAGMAMQAIVRSGSERSTVGLEHVSDHLWQHPRRIASTAYIIAAAMVAEKRAQEGGGQ